MKNPNSTSGIGEDIIRSITNLCAAEMHFKTLYEKTLAEMENGMIDLDDVESVNRHIEKANSYREDMNEMADLRRRTMKTLFDMFDGDKDMWCMVKHLASSSMTTWESYLASNDDPELLELSVDTNKAFIKALSRFLGMEITECASCFADMIKAEGDNEYEDGEIA